MASNIAYLVLTFAVYPAAGLLLAYLGGRALGAEAGAVVRVMLLCQCLVVACVAPFFHSACGGAKPIQNVARSLLKTLGVIAASALIAAIAPPLLGVRAPLAWAAKTAGILAGFGTLLVCIGAFVQRLHAAPAARLLVVYSVAAMMLGTVFYANPAIAVARAPAKAALMQAAVTANPLICVAGSATGYDILLSRRSEVSLYSNSLIGPDHLYRYPAWWWAALYYCAAGAVFFGASMIRRTKKD
ncbi:MAG TPA: hypothetical protein VM141_09755 [Planctomycetota bacterium]|nr:hypothetical protein [Planctomycetota bacterium]